MYYLMRGVLKNIKKINIWKTILNNIYVFIIYSRSDYSVNRAHILNTARLNIKCRNSAKTILAIIPLRVGP